MKRLKIPLAILLTITLITSVTIVQAEGNFTTNTEELSHPNYEVVQTELSDNGEKLAVLTANETDELLNFYIYDTNNYSKEASQEGISFGSIEYTYSFMDFSIEFSDDGKYIALGIMDFDNEFDAYTSDLLQIRGATDLSLVASNSSVTDIRAIDWYGNTLAVQSHSPQAVSSPGLHSSILSSDYGLILYDTSNLPSELNFKRSPHDGGFNNIAFSPDGTQLTAVGDDGGIITWNTVDYSILSQTYPLVSEPNHKICSYFSNSEYFATLQHNTSVEASNKRYIEFFDPVDNTTVGERINVDNISTALEIKGNKLVHTDTGIAYHNETRIYDISSPSDFSLNKTLNHDTLVYDTALYRGSMIVASGEQDGTVLIYEESTKDSDTEDESGPYSGMFDLMLRIIQILLILMIVFGFIKVIGDKFQGRNQI